MEYPQKQYQLPQWNLLEHEFDLDNESKHPIREVRTKIEKKLYDCLQHLQGLIHPDPSDIPLMQEYSCFTDSERTIIETLFKQFMRYYRWSNLAAIKQEESFDAEFINKFFSDWKVLKEELVEIMEKQQQCWTKSIQEDQPLGYLG